MKIFEEMESRDHEELIFNYFKDVDLKMIVSLHDRTMGKTIGGLRMNRYTSDMDAVIDSLRLSQSMTYEGATAETDCGGGNAILVGNPKTDKTEAYFRAVGRFIETLKGDLIISPDLGTDVQDFKYIQRETENTIFGTDFKDKSRFTAKITACGVYWGIKACAKHIFGSSDLSGKSFAVQGLGNVGKYLVEFLKQENATLFVSDLVYDNIKEVEDQYPDIEVVKPSAILFLDTDFVVPCAVGSILNKDNIDLLRCKVIAGPALNIFTDDQLIDELFSRGITYAPGFLIAAGDLFLLNKDLKLGCVREEMEGIKVIYNLLLDILQRSCDWKVSPYQLAKEEALERYRQIKQVKNILC